MKTFAAVILAAGKGTRMKSRAPKALHPVCGKPMGLIVADAATSAGLDPIIFVLGAESAQLRSALGDRYVYAHQEQALGTGHALLQAESAALEYDNLLVLNADIPLITPSTLVALTGFHVSSEAPITVLTSTTTDPEGLGRVVRDDSGRIIAVVEQSRADAQTLKIDEVNVGVYCFRARWLWRNLPRLRRSPNGEVFLTDLVEYAAQEGAGIESMPVRTADEAWGVNTRLELSRAESAMRDRIRRHWMLEGVTIPDPASVYIDYDVRIGIDTVILPNTHVSGCTVVGESCEIGPNSVVMDSDIGDDSRVVASVVEDATLEARVHVGPFSHIRPGTHLEADVRVGNFGEVKNSRIGRGTRSGHFSYIGDAEVGANVNIGAGSITCNFDGENKNVTVIGDDVFIGCDTMMVAPVRIGDRSYTSAGSVVNRDVPPDAGAIGAPARIRSRQSRKHRS